MNDAESMKARLRDLKAKLGDVALGLAMNPVAMTKAQNAIDFLPYVLKHADKFDLAYDGWAPVLKLGFSDVDAALAGKALLHVFAENGIVAEARPDPYMMDMSKLVFVRMESLREESLREETPHVAAKGGDVP